MTQNNSPIQPYLKWAGGKRQLLPEIRKHLPDNIHTYTYYEPFVGAGAVFFGLKPDKAVINDCNSQLIMTYKAIKENVEELIRLLRIHKEMNGREYYYKIRNMDRDPEQFMMLGAAEKAARLIYLNKTCYNGLYRVNLKGEFNVPCGRFKNPQIFKETVLRRISDYLNSHDIKILSYDFEQAIQDADENAFVYFDPPYHRNDKTSFTEYQAGGFDEAGQERLCAAIIKLTKRGVKCLLSNSDTCYIRKLYDHDFFTIINVEAKRLINSSSSGRGNVAEVLIRNWQ